MLQLSLDERRPYVTNSLYSTWDNQFYPVFAPRTGSPQGRLQARDAAAELGEGVLRLDAELLEEA